MCPLCSAPRMRPGAADLQVLHRDRHARRRDRSSARWWPAGRARSRSAASPPGRGSRRSRAPGHGRPGRAAGASGTGPSISAWSTISVFALEMSSPVSTIVVQTRTSHSRCPEPVDDLLQPVLVHLPVRDRDPRLGHRLADPARPPTRCRRPGCARRRPGPRAAARGGSPRRPACRRRRRRRSGSGAAPPAGSVMVDISRMPARLISSVRGIGVADMRQHVDVRPQRGDVLLVLDAEPLLLVDDHQPEVLPPDRRLQQPVGADHDVDAAVGQALDRLRGLGGRR